MFNFVHSKLLPKAVFAACFCLIIALPQTAHAASTKLVLGVMPSMDYLPLAVALREGYCKELGLELTLQKFYSANERDAALQAGAVDGAVIDYTGAVLQISGGINLKLTSACDAPFYLLSASRSGISNLAQLKGRSIAVSRHTVIDYLVDMSLAASGLAPEDVNKVEINKIPLRFEMLSAGKVDVTGLPNPLAMLAEQHGCNMLGSNADLNLAITGIVFSGKAIGSKAELIRKMYVAYNKGADYLKKHQPEDVQDILISDMNFNEGLIAKTILPLYTPARKPAEKDVKSVINWLDAKGLLEDDVKMLHVVDGSFLE